MWEDSTNGIYFEKDNSLFGHGGWDLLQNLKIIIGKNKEVTIDNTYEVPKTKEAREAMSTGAYEQEYTSHQYWAYILPCYYSNYSYSYSYYNRVNLYYDAATIHDALWYGWNTSYSYSYSDLYTVRGGGWAGHHYSIHYKGFWKA